MSGVSRSNRCDVGEVFSLYRGIFDAREQLILSNLVGVHVQVAGINLKIDS
jgi:hypothetical protein